MGLIKTNAGLPHNTFVYMLHLVKDKYVVVDYKFPHHCDLTTDVYTVGSVEEMGDYEVESCSEQELNDFIN